MNRGIEHLTLRLVVNTNTILALKDSILALGGRENDISFEKKGKKSLKETIELEDVPSFMLLVSYCLAKVNLYAPNLRSRPNLFSLAHFYPRTMTWSRHMWDICSISYFTKIILDLNLGRGRTYFLFEL